MGSVNKVILVGNLGRDAELRLGEQVLHRLGEHVGGGVAQDRTAVGTVDAHARRGGPVHR